MIKGLRKTIRKYRKRRKAMQRRAPKAAEMAAKYMERKAKTLAPYDSGELKRSIHKKKIEDGYLVVGGYSGNQGFPVGLWANKQIKITTNPGNRFFAPDQSFRYGDAALSASGKPVQWSRKDRKPFWKVAEKMTIKKYRKRNLKFVRNSMR